MKVLVIGAGPAGVATALLLARCGSSVTLVERETSFERVFRGEGLMPLGIDALFEMGRGEYSSPYPAAGWNYPEVADSFSLRHRNILYRSLLVVIRTQVALRQVTPHRVVEPFDVVEDRYPSCLPAGKAMPTKRSEIA